MPWYNFNFEQQFNLIHMPCPFKDPKKILLHPYSNPSQFQRMRRNFDDCPDFQKNQGAIKNYEKHCKDFVCL